ncbi:MAG: GNAT family N-acetyltransferase [Clostridiales Family XIII bacterium]|jgi:ribosomal protein S18 acetylase RimI-like enzyme|nr:GNAT family N-acetyltransferase [Clostridiales Family XIII bacterium]
MNKGDSKVIGNRDSLTVGMLPPERMADFRWLIPADFSEIIDNEPERYIVMGAVLDGLPCGVIVAGLAFGDGDDGNAGAFSEIAHLCVGPDFRRLGVGEKLVHELMLGLADSSGLDKLRCSFAQTDDSPVAFFEALGFSIEASDGGVYHTTLGALEDLPFWKQAATVGSEYIPISKLPTGSLAEFSRRMMSKLDLLLPPFSEKGLLNEISHAFIVGGRVEGIAAVSLQGEALELSWLYCASEHIRHLPELLRAVYQAVLAKYPKDTPLHVSAVTESSAKLAEKLCPEEDFYPNFEAEMNLGMWQIRTLAGERQAELMAESVEVLDWWAEALR